MNKTKKIIDLEENDVWWFHFDRLIGVSLGTSSLSLPLWLWHRTLCVLTQMTTVTSTQPDSLWIIASSPVILPTSFNVQASPQEPLQNSKQVSSAAQRVQWIITHRYRNRHRYMTQHETEPANFSWAVSNWSNARNQRQIDSQINLFLIFFCFCWFFFRKKNLKKK